MLRHRHRNKTYVTSVKVIVAGRDDQGHSYKRGVRYDDTTVNVQYRRYDEKVIPDFATNMRVDPALCVASYSVLLVGGGRGTILILGWELIQTVLWRIHLIFHHVGGGTISFWEWKVAGNIFFWGEKPPK